MTRKEAQNGVGKEVVCKTTGEIMKIKSARNFLIECSLKYPGVKYYLPEHLEFVNDVPGTTKQE